MPRINNSELIKQVIEGAKINIASEQVPTQLAEKIVPVMEVNPNMLKITNVCKSTDTGGTLYTTPLNQDFYLTYCNASITLLDAGDKLASVYVTAILDNDSGASSVVNSALAQTSALITAANCTSSLSYPAPIKLKRGSVISVTASNTDGLRVCIGGYLTNN
jgi:hypothetical protein